MDRRRRLTWLKRLLVPTLVIALFIGSAAVVWASQPAAPAAATVNIEMRDNMFVPQNVTVNVGDTVVWTNVGQRPHDATAGNGAFSSPRRMMNGQTFSWTATTAGTIDYVCTIHEAQGMVGTIVVQGGTGGAAPPAAAPRTGGGGMAGTQVPSLLLGLLSVGLGAVAGVVAGLRRRAA